MNTLTKSLVASSFVGCNILAFSVFCPEEYNETKLTVKKQLSENKYIPYNIFQSKEIIYKKDSTGSTPFLESESSTK